MFQTNKYQISNGYCKADGYTSVAGYCISELYSQGKSLDAICMEVSGSINPTRIKRWRESHSEFDEKMKLAERVLAEKYIAETVSIADSTEDPSIAALQIKTRQFLANKLDRNRYGEQVGHTVEHKVDIGSLIHEADQRLQTYGSDGPDFIKGEYEVIGQD